MRFDATSLDDAVLVVPEKHSDERGFFARVRCAEEFRRAGLSDSFVQTNISGNAVRGTFRGLHFQVPPSLESKLVRCIRGAIKDVIVDLRPNSGSFLKHEWVSLDEDGIQALFIPPGFAHGFLTETDNAVVLYEMGDFYAPELSRGMRWDDPLLGIEMPGEVTVINPRDASFPDLDVKDLDCFRRDQ